MIYFQLFLSYLKIGFFGFGGGYSMLSLIQHEVVVHHQWISNAALSDIIAISQMTPGPIAINSATYIGYTVAGFWGSVVATIAVSLPSLTIMVLITQFLMRLKKSNYMDRIMIAMRPSVIGMIVAASAMLIYPDQAEGASMIDTWSWVLFGAAFVGSLRKVNPINIIILSAIAGVGIYYIPSVVASEESKDRGIVAQETKEQSDKMGIWSNYDLSNVEVVNSPDFEQEWANFIYISAQQQPHIANIAIKETMKLSELNPEALNALFALGEKYLYNPNSPLRNDELFIPMLEFMVESPSVESIMKIRPKSLLKIVSLNRIGRVANDFEIGPTRRMHQVEAPYTLLYFYDPECSDCKRTSAIMARSEELEQLKANGTIEVVATLTSENMAVDSLYDLKAIPSLYLLDEQKRVVLKDATIETILESLRYIQIK